MMIQPSKLGIKKLNLFLKLTGLVLLFTRIEMVIKVMMNVIRAIEKMTISKKLIGKTLLPPSPK
jgi:hypothetical protein